MLNFFGNKNDAVMKKNSCILALSVLLFSVFSCNVADLDVLGPAGGEGYDFSLVVNSDATKTTLGADGKSLVWSAGDKVSLFYKYGSESDVKKLSLVSGEGTSSAAFSGTLKSDTPTVEYVVYPGLSSNDYSNTDYISDYPICVSIPCEQKTVAGNLPAMANLSVGRYAEGAVSLKCAASLLKFTLSSSEAASVSIIDHEGVGLAGASFLAVSGEGVVSYTSITTKIDNAKKDCAVVLKPASGATLAAGEYYAVVWPGTYNGLTFTFTDASGNVAVKSASNSLTLEAGHIYDLKTIDSGLSYSENLQKVLNLDFRLPEYIHDNSNSSASAWPFSSPAEPENPTSAAGVTFTCGGYDFSIESVGEGSAPTYDLGKRGLALAGIKATDYITLPAIEGMKIVRVDIVTYASSSAKRPNISIADENGAVLNAAGKSSAGLNKWNITGSELGKGGRLILNNDSELEVSRIGIIYEKPSSPSSGSVEKSYVFCDGNDKYQLFSTKISTSSKGYTAVGERFDVTDENDSSLEFSFFATGGLYLHSTAGLRSIGPAVGDYIILPAISGKKLSRVVLTFAGTNYMMEIGLKAVTDVTTPTFGNTLVSCDTSSTTQDFNLSGKTVEAGARYALVITGGTAPSNGIRMLSMVLTYSD